VVLHKRRRPRKATAPAPDKEAQERLDEARKTVPGKQASPRRVRFRQQLRKEAFAMRFWKCPLGHGGKTADTRPVCPICDKKMVEDEG
jgi:hypothetical protein